MNIARSIQKLCQPITFASESQIEICKDLKAKILHCFKEVKFNTYIFQ